MNSAAEALVRGIVAAGIASGTREGIMLAQLAAQALQASGLTSPDLPPSGPSLSPDAIRMRRKRAEGKGGPPAVQTANGANKTNAFERGGVGGGVSSSHDLEEIDHPKEGGAGETVAERSNAFGPESLPAVRPIRNASDDGAFGMTVEAWCEGISLVTGRDVTRPTHGQVRQLIDAQQRHRPVTAEPVAWSRDSARDYAAAAKSLGRELSTFGYCRWLDSDRPSGVQPKAPGLVEHEAHKRADASAARPPRKAPSKPPEPLSPAQMREDMAKLFGGKR